MTFSACAHGCPGCPFDDTQPPVLPGVEGGPPLPLRGNAPTGGGPWAACIPWPAQGRADLPAGSPARVVSWLDIERVPPEHVAAGLRSLIELTTVGATMNPLLPLAQLVGLARQDPSWTGVSHGLQLLGLGNAARDQAGPWDRLAAYDATSGHQVERFAGRGFAVLHVRPPAPPTSTPDDPVPPTPDREPDAPWIDVLDWPDRRQLVLRATGACNLACPHCFVPRFGEPDLEALDEALDQVLEPGDDRPVDLTLSGGEPLLAAALPHLVARLNHAQPLPALRVSLQTNATVTAQHEALLADLARGEQPAALVNLASFDPDTWRAMAGDTGSFDDVLAGIEVLHRTGWTVTVNQVLTRRNRAETGAYLREVADRWGGDVRVTISSLSPDTPTDVLRDQGLSYAEVGAAIAEAVHIARRLGLVLVFAGGDCAPPACCMPSELVDPATWFGAPREPVEIRGPEGPFERGTRYQAPTCRDCRHTGACPGIPASYAGTFSLDDLRPVR